MMNLDQFKAMAQAMSKADGTKTGQAMEAMAAFVSFQPDHVRRPLQVLASFVNSSGNYGPPSPPPWAMRLFETVAEAQDLPPELLAALAWTGSSFDPGDDGGLMGLSPLRAGQDGLRAPMHELVDRNEAAVNAVRLNVEVGARELARAIREEDGDPAEGVRLFLERQGVHRPDPFNVVATFAVYLARNLPRERMDQLNARLQEERGGP